MNTNNLNEFITFLTVKRFNKNLGYLWIYSFFISKEGYRQMYKLGDEIKYNIKKQLKKK